MLSPQEFSDAYEACYSRTIMFLRSRGVFPDVAEEVAQAAWARGWERRSQLKSECALLPWVNSIALNVLRGCLRQQSKSLQFPEGGGETIPANQHMSLDDHCDLKRLLGRCRPEDRQLLWAYWAEGFTSKEIASKLVIKPVSVRVKIGRIARVFERLQHGSTRGPNPIEAAHARHATGLGH